MQKVGSKEERSQLAKLLWTKRNLQRLLYEEKRINEVRKELLKYASKKEMPYWFIAFLVPFILVLLICVIAIAAPFVTIYFISRYFIRLRAITKAKVAKRKKVKPNEFAWTKDFIKNKTNE